MRIIQTDDLHYQAGVSDKVYSLALGEQDGQFTFCLPMAAGAGAGERIKEGGRQIEKT